MRRAVHDVRPRAEEALAFPIGEQFGARARRRTGGASAREEAQSVLREWQPETSLYAALPATSGMKSRFADLPCTEVHIDAG